MKIYTDLVSNKKNNGTIRADLHKHSQEYRVLAILRYLFPGKYETMIVRESPDLQDDINHIGIEVTSAVREKDMEALNAFSKLRQDRNNQKLKNIIEKSDHSLVSSPMGLIMDTTGTSDGEKKRFQESLRKKKAKLHQYKVKFEHLGLAVILEMPTSEAEIQLYNWIREVFQEDNNFYDFVYVISERFCIYCETQTDFSQKWSLSSEEWELLSFIAKMTAEGTLTLEDEEWK